MRIPYVLHDDDGRVLMDGRAPSLRAALLQRGRGRVLPGVVGDLGGCYVTDGVTVVTDDDGTMVAFDGTLRPRPALPGFDKTAIAADGADAATLSGLPEGATVSVDGGDPVPVLVDRLVIVSTMPASYDVLVSCWPYLDYRETIVAA